jgi:uncharacterized membrane protein
MSNLARNITWIDILRGIAILIMIPANLSPWLGEPHAIWYRMMASYAAPTFIMVSAGMIVLNSHKHNLRYYLSRGGLLIGFGALADICLHWLLPFTSIDVLYLIGVALPITFLAQRYSSRQLLIFGLLFFIITSLLQKSLGYHTAALQVPITQPFWPGTSRILLSWFVDGWFPLFPWLAYGLLATVFFRFIFNTKDGKIQKSWLVFAICAVVLGFLGLFLPINVNLLPTLVNGGIIQLRDGYSEIFYPSTLPYILSSWGMVIIFAFLAQKLSRYKISSIIATFGRYTLLIYFFHQAVGTYVINFLLSWFGYTAINSRLLFTLSVLATTMAAYGLCKIVEEVKKVKRPKSLALQLVFGK